MLCLKLNNISKRRPWVCFILLGYLRRWIIGNCGIYYVKRCSGLRWEGISLNTGFYGREIIQNASTYMYFLKLPHQRSFPFRYQLLKKYLHTNGNSYPHIINPPVSQWTPVKPNAQEQLYPFTKSVQLAPFWHGILRHSSMSAKIQDDVMTLKRFPHQWPFVKGIYWWMLHSPHKSQWCGASLLLFCC